MTMPKEEETNPLYGPLQSSSEAETSPSPDGSVELLVQAQPVAEAPKAASRASILPRDLTWDDTFYNNEDDIVAVFDLDQEAILAYSRAQCFRFMLAVVLAVVFTLIIVSADDPDGFTVFFSVFYGVCFVNGIFLAKVYCKKARAASDGGIHMAMTSNSVRYDQDVSNLSKKILLNRIVVCTVAEKKFWNYSSWNECTINLVTLQIVGAKPITYMGIKRAKDFQKLLVSLQQRQVQGPGTPNVV